jgi:release factor glutamine methyltransferase
MSEHAESQQTSQPPTGSRPSQAAPWTVGRLLTWTTEHFRNHHVDEPRLCAEILLAKAMNCPRIRLYTQFETAPPTEAISAFRESVKSAANHAPVAHLTGEKEFFSLPFVVTPDVLIPRPETETLVQKAVELIRREKWSEPRVLDLGTGSGCVLVAILSQVIEAAGVGTDVSEAAVAVASQNVERHGLVDRATILRASGFDFPPGAVPGVGFHLIVSNPPYIPEADWRRLPAHIRDHEPASALLAGADGMDFYRMIAERAGSALEPSGHILVEIGAGQTAAVVEIFSAGGAYEHVGTYREPPDPHDRVLHFRPLC